MGYRNFSIIIPLAGAVVAIYRVLSVLY